MIIESPIGNLEILDNGRAITQINLTDMPACNNSTKLQRECAEQLDEYFSGNRTSFEFPIEFSGTDFQKSVWNALLEIPFGVTMTYGEIAKKIGRPGAARAVGGACNRNHILIAVPCHRVVGSNGKLTGFACGIDIKSHLINLEQYEVSDV